jgi:uridine phosphorylase
VGDDDSEPGNWPLAEYDPDPDAFIEPAHVARPIEGIPQAAIACFFPEVVADVASRPNAQLVVELGLELRSPLYALDLGDERRVAVFQPGVGAPLAVEFFEEAIAHGCRKFVACGGAGALVPGLVLGHVVVPDAAVRDEGTSFHYVAPGREILADPAAVAIGCQVLRRHDVPYSVGKTWTTDAVYRETPAKIARRRAEGCITVEMEAAALLAVTRHRGVRFVQYLYAGDDVSGETWDHRSWQTASARRSLFDLAVEAALSL